MKQQILVIDDSIAIHSLVSNLLAEEETQIHSAADGEYGMTLAESIHPDLILLDILMPGIDGYEVCRQLKADDQLKNIPVIFISALNEAFDKVSAFSVGGVNYVTKPFQVEEVLARVQTHLSIESMRQQLEEQNRKLQEQNGELEAFAHTVAHDLKNP